MLTALFILALITLGIGIYMIMSSKEKTPQAREISMEHDIIKVRNIETGHEEVYQKVDPEDIENNHPAAYYEEFEEDELNDLTLVERLRSSDVSLEEKRLIAEQLLGCGYKVNLSVLEHAPLKSQVVFPDSGSEEVNPDTLKSEEPGDYVIKPDAPAEGVDAANDGEQPEDESDEDSEEDESEDKSDEDANEQEYDVLGSLGLSKEDLPAESGPDRQEEEEEDGGEETEDEEDDEWEGEKPKLTQEDEMNLNQALAEYEPQVDRSFGEYEETGDEHAERTAKLEMELMTFISRSYRKGLLTAAMVHLAEERIPLKVESLERNEETKERIRREIQEFSTAKKAMLDSMSVENFGKFIREEVEKTERARKTSVKEEASEKTEPEKKTVVKTKKAKSSKDVVTVKLSSNGGMKDFMWKRN